MKQIYRGGCHCGAIAFEASIDVAAGSIKCNCSICAKGRLWSFAVAPEDFHLLKETGALTDYVFGAGNAHHYFCNQCGIRPYEYIETRSGHKYYNVSVASLDGLSIDDLMAAPTQYQDGLHGRWDVVPQEIRYL